MSDLNVASLLAAHDPGRTAVIVARTGARLTYRELSDASDALAHGLVAAGITRGTRVAVMAPPSLDFFPLVFALFKVAAVPVMIDPGMGARNLGTCLAEAEPAAFIGIPKAHLARRLFGWAKGCISVNVGRWKCFCHHSTVSLTQNHRDLFPIADVAAEEIAAILFTSGSTGLAKGVVYTHGIFSAQVGMLKRIYGIEPGEVDLCTFPLFALFGPALGMTCVVPTMNFSRPATIDAKETVAAIVKYQATNLFGSPAVIRRLAHHNSKLPTLRRAISAGAPARLNEVAAFASLLPAGAQLFTPYGATEALPVANIGSDELLATREQTEQGAGICIGRPVPGVSVHVIPISDDAVPVFDASRCLPVGEIGEFVVRGPIVTKSYWKRDDATRLAKMTDPATGETLHRMGDVGYFDDQGRLWYCGRKSQRVVTPNGTLFTDQVEPILNSFSPYGLRAAMVGVGGTPVICVEGYGFSGSLTLDEMKERAERVAVLQSIQTFLCYPKSFPFDPRHNSKINREALAAWAAKKLQQSP